MPRQTKPNRKANRKRHARGVPKNTTPRVKEPNRNYYTGTLSYKK
jgi:hypothetical protein